LIDKSISIVFPAFNEEAIIKTSVLNALSVLKELTDDYEILIIDDASTDRTGQIAEELVSQYKGVRVIHHERNQGLGGGLRTGFSNASKQLVLYSDSDLPCNMSELKHALRVMDITRSDVVTAYRHDRINEGMIRIIYSFFYNSLIRIIFGMNVKDVNFSFKLFRREVFDSFILRSEGSFIDAELLIKCHKKAYKIQQFGVDYLPRTKGTSTLSSLPVILKILREMFLLRKELK